jgi:peroxiredoxin
VDLNDKPVGGAELIVQRPDATGRKYLRSDAQGRFRTRVAEAGSAGLIITRDGFAPTYRGISIVAGGPAARLQLSPARVLRGRVLDQNQRPVPGAKVRLTDWQGTGDLLKFQAVTDAEGRFKWTGAPLDQVVLQVSRTNYSTTREAVSIGEEEVVLQLMRAPGVYGKVFDAETRKPVESFTVIPGRKYSQEEVQIHWERYSGMRGRDGEYSLRVENYMFQPEARVLVEAPGYEPQISPPFRNPGSYTNDFALKKGRGISGVVLLPDGSPAAGATLLLVESGENASLEMGGQLRGSGSSADVVRSDAQGRFEFTPKLDADKVFASHEAGFAELKPAGSGATNRVVLQKWGRIHGALRVGDGTEGTVRLQNRYDRYSDSAIRPAMLSFYWKAETDTNGQFLFEKVPPGEHRLALEYRFKENNNSGETPLSHGFSVIVKPGEATEATLGGTGRRVTGQVKLTGAEHSDLDWRRDVHKLTLVLSNPIAPPVFIPGISSMNQQQVWEDFNVRQQRFWQTEAGRAFERAERTYVLLFETNGSFHADNIPPGKYMLTLNVTDPEEDNYSRRTVGSTSLELTVPDEPGAKVNAPFSIADVNLTVRMKVRAGGVVPPFEAKQSDGKTFKLAEQRGKYVLLHFWGQSIGWSSSDIQTLQQLQSNHGARTNFIVIGCNLDPAAPQLDQFARNQRMTWPQLLLGEWGQSPVAGMFGVEGNTSCVLIDPAGKLVRSSLRGSAIRTVVENLLEAE